MCEFDWALLLEYVKVILSWPPLLFIFLFWFSLRFADQISTMIGKIKGFKLPGGSEITLIEKELQQEIAQAPKIELPGANETAQSEHASVDLTMPSATVDSHGGPTLNFSYSPRIKGLYPNIDPTPVVKWMHENPGPALNDYVDKVFQLHCERTFNMVFGSQVQLLEYLNSHDVASPKSIALLVPYFESHLKLIGRQDGNLTDFLAFLVVRGLIENVGTAEGPLYQITQAGREFLLHIKQYYSLQWNTKAF